MARLFMIIVLLGATIGLPYVYDRMSRTRAAAGQAAVSAPPGIATPAPALALTNGTIPSLAPTPGSTVPGNPVVDGPRFSSVDQVLRFDVTKEWVYRNWSRKSTGPTDVGLFAVRVPLVTGTHLAALAGSLTYFFNTYGQVEHISFRGHTGDTTPLVNFLTRTYGLQPAAAPTGEQLFQVKRGNRVQSELVTRPESVLRSTSPHGSFAVELELARPGSQRFLPPRTPQLEIPQVASSTPSAAAPPAAESADTAAETGGMQPYLDKFRYATPQEEGQVLWRRWPN
jgi:hypothetical protein